MLAERQQCVRRRLDLRSRTKVQIVKNDGAKALPRKRPTGVTCRHLTRNGWLLFEQHERSKTIHTFRSGSGRGTRRSLRRNVGARSISKLNENMSEPTKVWLLGKTAKRVEDNAKKPDSLLRLNGQQNLLNTKGVVPFAGRLNELSRTISCR